MATTKTSAADKKKKQIYMIAGLGVLLAVLLAIQLPKFLGGSETPESTSGAVPTSEGAPTGTPTGTGSYGAVSFGPGVVPAAGEGQLASFSLFSKRDPFLQIVKEPKAEGSQDGEPTGVKVKGGNGSTASGGAANGGGPTGASDPGTSGGLTVATISVNGVDEVVEVKQRFPKADPTFVLLSLKPKVARIGVVGGAFTGGQAIALQMGKPLTLVNTTTGARYTLRLLYTGSQPEQVQQFTTQASNN